MDPRIIRKRLCSGADRLFVTSNLNGKSYLTVDTSRIDTEEHIVIRVITEIKNSVPVGTAARIDPGGNRNVFITASPAFANLSILSICDVRIGTSGIIKLQCKVTFEFRHPGSQDRNVLAGIIAQQHCIVSADDIRRYRNLFYFIRSFKRIVVYQAWIPEPGRS